MNNDAINVKITPRDLESKTRIEEIIRSTEGFRIQNSSETHRPELLIFELGQDTEDEFKRIDSMLSSGEVGDVFLLSENTDATLLLRAIRAGAKEFLSQPLKENDLRQALVKFKQKKEDSNGKKPAKSGTIINVVGTKGGVGTTTVAVSLASNLAEKNKDYSVALLDMNMLFGEIPLFLDIQPSYHWGEITKNVDRLDRQGRRHRLGDAVGIGSVIDKILS